MAIDVRAVSGQEGGTGPGLAASHMDPTVRKAVEDAKIAAQVAEVKRNIREVPDAGLSGALTQQLADLGIPMGAQQAETTVTSTSVIFKLWNRADGEPSNVRYDELGAKLAVRFPKDHPTLPGELVWTDTPMTPLNVGTCLCRLHKDHPDRAVLDSLGFAGKFCVMDHLISEYEVERHLRFKHRDVWNRLERKRTDDRETEMMALQRAQTEALTKLLERGVAPAAITEATGVNVGVAPVATTALPLDDEQAQRRRENLARGRATAAANRAAKNEIK